MIKTRDQFIEKARKMHGGIYSYDRFVYTKSVIKSVITCEHHGDFLQSANKHLNGQGCPQCRYVNGVAKKTAQYHSELFEKLRRVHGDKYDYSNTTLGRAKDKICVICHRHGVFNISQDQHLRGHGCKHCGYESASRKATGFTNDAYKRHVAARNTPPELYVLRLSGNGERFIKIGVSYNVSNRYTKANMPYEFEVIGRMTLPSNNVLLMEQLIKKGIKQYFSHLVYNPKIKFGGWTECYTSDLFRAISQENGWTDFTDQID